jgi:hypothetical protein
VERCPQDSSVAGPHAEGASAGNLRSLQLGTTAFSSPRQAQKRVTLPRQSLEAGRKASLSIALFCASTLFCVGNQRVPIGDEGAVRTPDSTTHFCVPTQKCSFARTAVGKRVLHNVIATFAGANRRQLRTHCSSLDAAFTPVAHYVNVCSS